MSEWRNGGTIPRECESCSRVDICRGGCRVEAFARGNDRRTLPEFANLDNLPVNYRRPEEIVNFTDDTAFTVSDEAKFLKDSECYRVSSGILAVHLTDDFAMWLMSNPSFTFSELLNVTGADREELTLILNMLAKNNMLTVKQG